MKKILGLLLFFLIVTGGSTRAAQWSPALSNVIQEAKKEGKLKLLWGEGTLGGSKGAARFEQMMNKHQTQIHLLKFSLSF